MSFGILLDTNVLLWWTHQPTSLSKRACETIASAADDVFVSPVSAIEIATKSRKGKLEFQSPLSYDFVAQTAREGFKQLPISSEHAQLAGSFDSSHKDPWDRLLAAQGRLERLTVITNDEALGALGVPTLW